jgi:leucyl aminopeptidase
MFTVQNHMDFTAQQTAIIVGLSEKNKKVEGLLGELDAQLDGQLSDLLKEGDISVWKDIF